jgi:hypothetical protein
VTADRAPLRIVPFSEVWRSRWDTHVRTARNGHFLFEQGFLDHHRDRFDDACLLFCRGERIVFVLPAHRIGDRLVSHGGLPFAGLIASPKARHADTVEAFDILAAWMAGENLRTLDYRPVPWPYHSLVFEDDLYELHRRGASLASMKLSAGYPGTAQLSIPSEGTGVRVCTDLPFFWRELESFLARKHYRPPVHTAAQMAFLLQRFPDNITLFTLHLGTDLLAGALYFFSSRVARVQYLFHTPAAEKLDKRISQLLDIGIFQNPAWQRPWIDLGTSMDPVHGRLHAPLLTYKENCGARAFTLHTWEWSP